MRHQLRHLVNLLFLVLILPPGAKGEHAASEREQTYALRYEEQGGAETLGLTQIKLTISGTLTRGQIGGTPSHQQIRYTGRQIVARANGQTAVSLQTAIERGCLVTLDQTGTMTRIAFPVTTGPTDRNFWRGLLARLAFVRPRQSGRQWQVKHQEPVGTGNFRYLQTGSSVYTRTLLGYALPPRLIGEKERSAPVVRGTEKATFRFDSKGMLQHLEGTTQMRSVLLPSTEVASGTAAFTLHLIRTARWDSAHMQAQVRETMQFVPSSPSKAESDSAARLAAMHRELGDQTSENLLQRLFSSDTVGLKPSEEQHLFAQMSCWAALNPTAINQLQNVVLTPTAKRARTLALAVLGASVADGTHLGASRAAENALRTLLSTQDASLCQAVLQALSDCKNPQLQTFQVVRRLAQCAPSFDTRQAALLTLGSLAQNAARSDSTEAEREAQWLVARLKAAKNASETQILLLALGNAGAPTALPTLAQFAQQPSYRATALYAMRFVPGKRVTARLLKALDDPEESVREEAARALLLRPLTAQELAILGRKLARERKRNIRLLLLENIQLEWAFYPDQARALLKPYQRDRDPEIRAAVSAGLNESQ